MTADLRTTIELAQDVPLIRVTRAFAAARPLVFRAHTEAELLVRWNGPNGTLMAFDTFDCRTGGGYRFTHTTPEGTQASFRGCFHEVRPDALIIRTFTYEATPDHVALERVTFEERAAGRTLVTVESLHGSFADRDAFVASGMETGAREGYDRLEQVLLALRATATP